MPRRAESTLMASASRAGRAGRRLHGCATSPRFSARAKVTPHHDAAAVGRRAVSLPRRSSHPNIMRFRVTELKTRDRTGISSRARAKDSLAILVEAVSSRRCRSAASGSRRPLLCDRAFAVWLTDLTRGDHARRVCSARSAFSSLLPRAQGFAALADRTLRYE